VTEREEQEKYEVTQAVHSLTAAHPKWLNTVLLSAALLNQVASFCTINNASGQECTSLMKRMRKAYGRSETKDQSHCLPETAGVSMGSTQCSIHRPFLLILHRLTFFLRFVSLIMIAMSAVNMAEYDSESRFY
jgi:hypothetical protein